jgi:hypothetical protein
MTGTRVMPPMIARCGQRISASFIPVPTADRMTQTGMMPSSAPRDREDPTPERAVDRPCGDGDGAAWDRADDNCQCHDQDQHKRANGAKADDNVAYPGFAEKRAAVGHQKCTGKSGHDDERQTGGKEKASGLDRF